MEHRRPGGRFTFYTGEIDSLARGNQRRLLQAFDTVELSFVDGLEPPEGCEYHRAPSMLVVKPALRAE